MPFAGGYRVLWHRRRLARLLTRLQADALEVSDRTTLRWTGRWARSTAYPPSWCRTRASRHCWRGRCRGCTVRARRAVADWLNRRTGQAYQQVICTTGWAAAEFERIGAGNLVRVPLGVDLATFTPRGAGSGQVRAPGQILLVPCGRLSAEKKPQRSLTTLATLRASGLPVRLVVAGDGPLRPRLERRAARAGLPVTFVGFLPGRPTSAALLASADVALARAGGNLGLAALEALACGTPVVVSAGSALPEVAGEAGASVAGQDLAAGVSAVLARPEQARRAAARARAEQYDWATAVRGFLVVHGAGQDRGEAGWGQA